jgi:hypothetical protein
MGNQGINKPRMEKLGFEKLGMEKQGWIFAANLNVSNSQEKIKEKIQSERRLR